MTKSGQRARIARVRTLQHGIAATAAAQAAARVRELEDSAERLGLIHSSLRPADGLNPGARIASLGELAMRLDDAREGLKRSIGFARQAADAREGSRLVARRDQEGAERLHGRALAAETRAAERRIAGLPPRRNRFGINGDPM